MIKKEIKKILKKKYCKKVLRPFSTCKIYQIEELQNGLCEVTYSLHFKFILYPLVTMLATPIICIYSVFTENSFQELFADNFLISKKTLLIKMGT